MLTLRWFLPIGEDEVNIRLYFRVTGFLFAFRHKYFGFCTDISDLFQPELGQLVELGLAFGTPTKHLSEQFWRVRILCNY